MGFKKPMDLRQRGKRLLQIIQAELDQRIVPLHGLGGGEHVFNRLAAQRQADFGQAHGQKPGGESRRKSQGHLFSTTARYYRAVSADATIRCLVGSIAGVRGGMKRLESLTPRNTLGAHGLNTLVTLTPPPPVVTFCL